jgi:hypothetical protein
VNKKFGAYKLDLTKAYDSLDWGFLKGLYNGLAFIVNGSSG